MKDKKAFKKSLFCTIGAILLSLTMFVGSTFAWFTDSVTSSGNIIASGTLKVDLELLSKDGTWSSLKESKQSIFNSNNWEPGYTDVKILKVENEGSLALKWKAKFIAQKEFSILADAIDVYVLPSADEITYPANNNLDGYTRVGTVREFAENIESTTKGTLKAGEDAYLAIALTMPKEHGNEYSGLDLCGEFNIMILATQLAYEEDSFGSDYDKDAEYVDMWDGTASIDWYTQNPDATTFTLSRAEDLAGLAQLVDGTADVPKPLTEGENAINLPVTFEGKTVKLDINVDLYKLDENGEPICFDPIGSYRHDKIFEGTFDGQGFTISNLSQNTWALDNGWEYVDLGLGLFGAVENATIKNLVMDKVSISGESALCGVVSATAYGDCTFENITVKNSQCADYQYYAGGIVGWASGKHKYINCNVDASTIIATQWGDFDNSTGGIIGGCGGSAEILIKDCNVACRIDAYNDVTSSYQWYAYRRCGMLIGNTGKTETNEGRTVVVAPQLTCENVTVTYGDWANYTYCEFAGTAWPYVRVQAGVSNSAYSNPRYGHPTDANGNEVVDDNHVHNEGEDHFILCEFDQLYGGGQGVYGTATHDGVTVIYNNK